LDKNPHFWIGNTKNCPSLATVFHARALFYDCEFTNIVNGKVLWVNIRITFKNQRPPAEVAPVPSRGHPHTPSWWWSLIAGSIISYLFFIKKQILRSYSTPHLASNSFSCKIKRLKERSLLIIILSLNLEKSRLYYQVSMSI
jgi:hypothetical protein